MSRRPLVTVALLVAAILPASAAHAAYAPKLSIEIAPTTFRAGPALTSTITQEIGEPANKTVVVGFPVGFSSPFGYTISPCTDAQEAQKACPPETRIGTATAKVLLVDLTGGVFFGATPDRKIKLIVLLGDGLTAQAPIEGVVSVRPDGGFDVTFDNLPNLPTQSFVLALDGPPKSLVTNPSTCGTKTFVGRFTSHDGQTATSNAPVQITGCVNTPPRVAIQDVSSRRFRQGRRATVSYDLSEAASVVANIRKRTKTGRVVQTRKLQGVRSDNSLKVGKGLKPGTYVLELVATDPEGAVSKPERASFKVLKKKKKR